MEKRPSATKTRNNRLSPTAANRLGRARKKEATQTGPKANARLLEAAIGLCCRKGVAATSVDEIVEESGVARMTLYNRYGSKDGLIHAALTHEAGVWRAWFFSRLAETPGTPREKLLAWFDIMDEWFRREDYLGCALMNAAMESRNTDQKLAEIIRSHKSHVLEQLRALIHAAGLDDVELLTQQFDLLIDGAIVKAAIKKAPTPALEARKIAELLLAHTPRAGM
ncbi:TetR/AcrR family transcriptional regulator [Methylocystis sp. IM3]|uniref:TetR/AcrR family transcriptional regulator n=1 Tax=unclassified Methylocystis TaxID=2625913 RepID=UPI0030FBF5BF